MKSKNDIILKTSVSIIFGFQYYNGIYLRDFVMKTKATAMYITFHKKAFHNVQ